VRDSPPLKVAQSDAIESVAAEERHSSENDSAARAAERQVALVTDGFEPPRRGHIPKQSEISRLAQFVH
jgi:hypothetical protein